MMDWADWTAEEIANSREEVMVIYRERDQTYVALCYRVYDGPECRREKLLAEAYGMTQGEAHAKLQEVRRAAAV